MSETEAPRSSSSSSLRRRLAIGLAVALGLYATLGFLIVPLAVKSQLVRLVADQTGVTPELAAVRFDPFRLRLTLRDFALPDPRGESPVLAFDLLVVDVAPLGFFSADVALDELTLRGPRVSAVVDESGALNLQRMLAESPAATREAAAPEEETEEEGGGDDGPLIVEIARVDVVDGRLGLRDAGQSPPFEVVVAPIDLGVDDLTTRADRRSEFLLELSVGERTGLRWSGSLEAEPLGSQGRLELSDLDLRLPWDYLSERLRFEVEQGGLDLEAEYSLGLADGLELSVDQASARLRGLAIRDPAEERAVLSLPDLSVEGASLRVDGRGLERLGIGAVRLDGGRVHTRLEADGTLHLAELFAPVDPEDARRSEPPPDPGIDPAQAAREVAETVDAVAEGPGTPSLRLDLLEIEGFELDLEDRSTARPVAIRLAPVSLAVRDFRSEPGSTLQLELAAATEEGGRIALSGPVTPEPLEATLDLRVEQLGIGRFQPYLEDSAKLDVPGGTLTTALDVKLATVAEQGLDVRVRGRLALDDVLTVDRRARGNFVEWRRFRIEGIDFGPERLAIAEVGLAGARANVVLDAEGRSNLDAIFGASDGASSDEGAPVEEAAGADERSGGALPIEIGAVVLEEVAATFSDLSLDPDFSIGLEGLGGRIEGLSSERAEPARVELSGRTGDGAPVRVAGRIDPLGERGGMDLEIEVDGVSLPTFTPYSARYLGFAIDRGKLDLSLEYEIESSRLVAENRVALHQFAFGRAIPSEQATNLPVRLAVALLRDPSGDIRVDLPIRGDLDDPSFSVLGVLGKSAVNLVTRVAASPFAAVAGIVGGSGEDLSRVVFVAGSAALSEDERADLGSLAEALAARPALRLEIRGRANTAVDGPRLRAARIEEAARVHAFQRLPARERERLGGPATLELDPDQRLAALEAIYRERLASDPRERFAAVGASGDASETERLAAVLVGALASTVELVEADLRSLASARARHVQDALLATERVEPERVFLVDVEIEEAAPAGDGSVPTELALTAD